jgi:Arc/MetJ-type ribon-helix-helix transcriptional regulator
MQVNLSGSTEKSIERRLAAGQFDSPEEVIRAAIGQLDEYDETVADLRESLGDETAGRLHSIPDVDREMRQKHGFKRPS